MRKSGKADGETRTFGLPRLVLSGLIGPLSLVLGTFLATVAAAAPADRVVAVVGDQPILLSELSQAATFLRLSQPDSALSDSALEDAALGRLIDDLVLEEQARRESVEVAPSDVAADVDADMAAVKGRFENDDMFKQALAGEGYTERALRQRYETDARRKLLARKLMDKEGLTQIYVSPAEAERFYNENRDSIARVPGRVTLAHVLIAFAPSPAADSVGQRRMVEVLDVLTRGGDFATVAASFSDDPKTAARGGDRGWVNVAQLSPGLSMVLSQLKPGQTSPPFPTPDGYLVVQLEARTPDSVRYRQVLVRVPLTPADSARAKNLAASIRRKALAGVPFDSLARQYSQDPTTVDSGGRLGEFLTAGLAPPFNQVVAGMDSGAVSEPVLSEHGYHVIKVLAKQPDRTLSYLELQDNIRNYLYQKTLNDRLTKYLDRVRGSVYVQRLSTT
ncbi:MAG TPA: peptidylprolyl isomerase [bacterium]|nr:peptidylprolyl isomerase [bacterium]